MVINIESVLKQKTELRPEKFQSYQSHKLPNLVAELLDRRITLMTEQAIMEAIHKACLERKKLTVASCNVHTFNVSMQIPWFYEFQQNADITLCDGFGIIKALRYMGLDLSSRYRVSGTELIPKLLKYCQKQNFSVFLLRTKPQHLAKALKETSITYPGLRVSGHHGYFDTKDPQQNQALVEQISRVKPHILIVCMGVPLQEQWVQQNFANLDANVFIPCGAVIDRLAGEVTNCPEWLSNNGLEWLHRLVLEPKRLASLYLLGNPAFLFYVALAKSQGISPLRVSEM